MLLSITSDNSSLPEAFAINMIKSFLFISVTQMTLKTDKRPHVFLADDSRHLRVCVLKMLACATICSLNCVCVVSRFQV